MLTFGPVSGIWLFRIAPACFRMAGDMHSNLANYKRQFSEMCNLPSGQWCSLMFQIKYRSEIQFLSFFIAHLSHFVNPIDFCRKTFCLLTGKGKGGWLQSFCSVLALLLRRRTARKTTTKRKQPPLGVKVLNSSKICSEVKVEVGEKMNTPVKYRYSILVLKYSSEVVTLLLYISEPR